MLFDKYALCLSTTPVGVTLNRPTVEFRHRHFAANLLLLYLNFRDAHGIEVLALGKDGFSVSLRYCLLSPYYITLLFLSMS